MEPIITIEKDIVDELEIYYFTAKMANGYEVKAEGHRNKKENFILLYRRKEDQFLLHHLGTALIITFNPDLEIIEEDI
jgi:hypothetical protein